MGKRISKIAAAAGIAACSLLASCSDDVYFGDVPANEPPAIRLTCGPPEGLLTCYRVHFYWMGDDPDGRVDRYEYVMVTGDPIGFSEADTAGADAWTATTLTDMEFEVSAEAYDTTVTISYNAYARYHQMHTFFIRAMDDRGARSEPAYRSFNAFTLAPTIFITQPPLPPTASTQHLGPVITFGWEGKDPIDSPSNYQAVDSVRFMHTYYNLQLIKDMNERPELFEALWSPWFAYDAPGDSGKSTVLGDDEMLGFGKTYVFAVQAKDEAGAISAVFDERTNVRRFMIKKPTGPFLTVVEPFLGVSKFIGTNMNVKAYSTPGGFLVNFSWYGDASDYGAFISTYRYGWDIMDLADPYQWETAPSPYCKQIVPRRFWSGVHSLFIEAVDNLGTVTLAKIEIGAVPLTMNRDLLWIDDFLSSDFIQTSYSHPTESEHDELWLGICSTVRSFDPALDVYDTAEHGYEPPDMEFLWRYKNIIWTYGSSRWDFNAWMKTIKFVPEGNIGDLGTKYTYNILTYYLELGGHLWTCGPGTWYGGLAAALPSPAWGPWGQTKNVGIFPLYLKCEMSTGPASGCPDTLGATSMNYRDYCVTVLDKVLGIFRPDVQSMRDLDKDALASAYRDVLDPITASHPELPAQLHLWEEVTKPGRYFDPRVRGFYYVEIYNPMYWMQPQKIRSRICFHPLYRMRTRNTRSPVNDTVIAFWTSAHAEVVAEAPGAVAAPSVHFGFPLWQFDHDEVQKIAEAVFREWKVPM